MNRLCWRQNEMLCLFLRQGDAMEEMQIEGRSELSDIVEEEEDLYMEDAGENKPKMLCKVESLNEESEMQMEELERNRTSMQDYPSKPSHVARRMNPPNQANSSPTQRRQGWKDQSYNSRSIADGNGDPRTRIREQRNPSAQIIDPDENLSDKEIYPSTRGNMPARKMPKDHIREDDLDTGFSDDEYDPRRRANPRPTSPDRYPPSSNPLRNDPHHPRPPHRGAHSRRASHDPTSSNPTPRNNPQRGRNPRGPHYGGKRREGGATRREYHDARYEGNYDSYPAEGGDNRVRFFVALFDYDPQTMSPNPDAADEELPFQEGQMIKIYGDKDPDGFYRGESNGKMGLVPGNMVSEVQVDADSSYYNKNASRPRSLGHLAMENREADRQPRTIKKMVAMYDYDPQEISPNVDAEIELSFSTGDVIYVIGDVDEDGFYMGELNGVKGLVPSNFLREVEDEDGKRRSKGTFRDDGQHTKHATEATEHVRGHSRGPEKQHYPSSNTGNKDATTTSGYGPPSNLWDERDFERPPRGPHVPPRGQRMAHQQVFSGPQTQPSEQHW
ncbi:hypothetical protein JTE90_026494 [Oedothorax gibbosus]|uniref:SH3 domain-containing protein n=1 Tax=Oedothorax gibbosus TaxID=931172 RepID=A0AAV6VP38_9ARAC|nr:hypothetical protein JTE90_026494 [Oedothorax gibbosus]